MSIFQIGVSGLQAFQRALATSGHNVANASTPGYSRQRVELSARVDQRSAFETFGNGVSADRVDRVVDRFLGAQVRGATTGASEQAVISGLAARLDAALSSEPVSVGVALDDFFAATADVAGSPDSLGAREALLSRANELSQRFASAGSSVGALRAEVNDRIKTGVGQVNELSSEIAELNRELSRLPSQARLQANDLYDRRDEALRQLSEQVSINPVVVDDGTVNVYLSTGQALVLGGDAHQLGVRSAAWGGGDIELAYRGVGRETSLGNAPLGGRLGGLQQFRDNTLGKAANELGRLATAVTTEINAQHRNGVDLSGGVGKDFFSIGAPAIAEHSGNTGGAVISVTVIDTAALASFSYELRFDGSDFKLLREPGGGSQTLSGSGPFTVDGLQIDIDTSAGGPLAGDRYRIEPYRGAAATMQVALVNPREIAAGMFVLATAASANSGTAVVTQGEVIDPTNPDLLKTLRIEFNDPPVSYDIIDDASGSVLVSAAGYTSGAAIEINGHRVVISGGPAAADLFTVAASGPGPSDNRNLLALSRLQDAGVLDGGGSSLHDAFGQTIAGVGAAARSARNATAAQEALLSQATDARDAVAGVNLDEEAANLMQFQQAYEAAARVIGVADELFQTLLRATGR